MSARFTTFNIMLTSLFADYNPIPREISRSVKRTPAGDAACT